MRSVGWALYDLSAPTRRAALAVEHDSSDDAAGGLVRNGHSLAAIVRRKAGQELWIIGLDGRSAHRRGPSRAPRLACVDA